MTARDAFWLSVLVYAAALAWARTALPEEVPLHFGAGGEPDRWGSRAEALWTFGLIGAGVALILGGLPALVGRISLRSPFVNLPHKDWWTATPEREKEAHRRISTDLFGVAAATMVLLVVSLVFTVDAANSSEPALGRPFWIVVIAYTGGVLIWAVSLSWWRYRPQEGR